MAKIKFGMMMTDARGKLGGQVFSKNKGGAYVRTKVTPTNPQSADQTTVRALFGAISQAWSALTASQIAAWNTAVEEWKSTDIFGDLLAPTGKELHQRLNNQLQVVGGAAITSPPAKVALPNSPVTVATIAIGAATITLTGAFSGAGIYIQVFGTTQVSNGTSFVKNKLRDIYSVISTGYVAADAYSAYVAKFGAPLVTDKVYLAVKYVGSNGQASPRQTILATIVA